MLNVGNLASNNIEYILQWLDLPSHLRLREASLFYRDDVPRQTTTLVARGCDSAQRCHDKIFTPERTLIHSITVNLAPRPPSSSFSFPCSSSSCGGYPRLDISARHTLTLLVREHGPAEFKVNNIERGGDFSGALLALEDNIDSARRNLCVLQLGLAIGAPRPYQDPRSHHWCMLRLRRVLGGKADATPAALAGRKVEKELADLTRALGAAVLHLVGPGFADKVERPELSAFGASNFFQGKACWPRLRELRLSCGIMEGDLEGLSDCLGSKMPALEVLSLEGHSFRAPPTDMVAFANALRSSSMDLPYTHQLTTLILKHFKVEGVAGLRALGSALTTHRFPRLSTLALDNCRLVDDQMRVLAAALPAMSRELKTLSFRSNYALSAEGISALAEVLKPVPVSTGRPELRHFQSDNDGRDQDKCSTAIRNNGTAKAAASSSLFPSNTTATTAPFWSVSMPPLSSSSCRPVPVISSEAYPCPCPLAIESLDLSYSCWWRRPRRDVSTAGATGADAGARGSFPLTGLLKALGEGACPRLRVLSLAGCYFGDKVVFQLVAALKIGCRALRVLDITGNLFGEEGVRLIADTLLLGKTTPHLRIVVNKSTELHPGMSPEEASRTVEAWIEYQKVMQASFAGSNGAALA